MVRDRVIADLKNSCKKLGLSCEKIIVEHPKNVDHGDYSTNLALQQPKEIIGKVWQSPSQIAKKIVEAVGIPEYLEKIEVLPPGFINFYLSKSFLFSQVNEILVKKEEFAKSDVGIGKKARVEFVSANPTGPLHIGNARGGPLGDTIANILKAAGFKVLKEFYLNDVGEQVRKFGESLFLTATGVPVNQLEYKGEYIKEIGEAVKKDIEKQYGTNFLISGDKKKLIELFTKIGVKRMEKEIINDCQAMGINFNLVYPESHFAHKPKNLPSQTEIVISRLKSVIKKKDEAAWFAPKDEFLKDRESVLIKSNGDLTYFANDIAYHVEKFEDEKFGKPDLIVDVWGSTHHGHMPRIQAAMSALGFDVSKLKFILYQFVRVKRGTKVVRMSKRAGDFVEAREVLDEVGKDAFRFFLLIHDPATHLDFDVELAKKKSADNPVYYIQYAHARASNILKLADSKFTLPQAQGDAEQSRSIKMQNAKLNLLTNPAEIALVKKLIQLPELVEDIAKGFQVHQLTSYAIETANLFHKFYEQCKVISDDQNLTSARLKLVSATQIIIATTLHLMGISAPEKM